MITRAYLQARLDALKTQRALAQQDVADAQQAALYGQQQLLAMAGAQQELEELLVLCLPADDAPAAPQAVFVDTLFAPLFDKGPD